MKKQDAKDRRDESRGMKRVMRGFDLKDNSQAGDVRSIETSDAEDYDMDRVRYNSVGTKGYAPQAFRDDR